MSESVAVSTAMFTFKCKETGKVICIESPTALEAMAEANKRFWPIWAKANTNFYGWMGIGPTFHASYGVWD